MAKVQFGVRVQPELKDLVENEAKEREISKADIVEEMIRLRYNNRETNDNNGETEHPTDAVSLAFIQHLRDQVADQGLRIKDLEKVNNEFTKKALNAQTLIEAPTNTSRLDRFKDVFR